MESQSTTELDSMTVDDLSEWLESKGIPSEFCAKFKDNFIDGTEFMGLTESEIKEMVPPIGLAKKIMKLVPKADVDPQLLTPDVNATPLCSRLSSPTSPVSPSLPSTSRHGGSISSISTTPSRSQRVQIPDYWREETQSCLDEGILNETSRGDITRTLVTLLVGKYGPKPGRAHCEDLARQLILKYPFVKDDLGTGYSSWVDKMLECLENRVKQSRKKIRKQTGASPNPKRTRTAHPKHELMNRYPVRVQDYVPEDSHIVAEHAKALNEEMKKPKPRDTVLLPLMKHTFHDRRIFVQNDASSVTEILDIYPALTRPAVIEHEMGMIIGRADIRTAFERAWTVSYVPSLLRYGERSKRKAMKEIYLQLVETDDSSRQKVALEILVAAMKCSSVNPKVNTLHWIYQEYEITETPEYVCDEEPIRSCPRIAAFVGEEQKQYFVLVERKVLCQVPSFQMALFITFSSFYVFHLEYPKLLKHTMFFLQDYVLAYPDSLRRQGSYLGTASDIKKIANTL